MAEAAELAQLKDIHLPQAITWWPLAPGWYVLFVLVLFLSIILAYLLHKRVVNARPKKQALHLLKSYESHYLAQKNCQISSARVSELLRRVALVYFPRDKVASLHGQAWVDFLSQTGKNCDFKSIHNLLLDAPFRNSESMDLTPLFDTAKMWIKQRRVPCSN